MFAQIPTENPADRAKEPATQAVPSLGDRNSAGDLSAPITAPPSPLHSRLPVRQLREPVATFTGRAAECERLSRMLRSATGAVATVSGVRNLSGVGKTELACRVAHDMQAVYPLQILIDFRGQSEVPLRPELALERVIRFLSPGEVHLPAELEPLINLYRSLISGHKALIVADDVRDVAQVRPLLPPPGCALLITSRARLTMQGVPTYHALELDVLPTAESAALLRLLCPRLSTAQAAELATRSSHLPLALQLIGHALREDPTRHFPDFVSQLAAERARLEAQRPGEGTGLDLLAVITLSFRCVDPWSRMALAQLTLLNTPFDRETAEAVVQLPPHASSLSEVLRRLQRANLLEHDPRSAFFAIHNLVRAYAHSQRDPAAEQPTQARLATYVTGVLKDAEGRYRQGREGMAEGLARFDATRLLFEASQAWALERATHDETAGNRLMELAQSCPALLTLRLSARARARLFEGALATARRLGERTVEARLLGYAGLAYRDLGQTPKALECYEASVKAARQIGDPASEVRALGSLGQMYLEQGQPQRAVAYFEPNLALARALGDRRSEGAALGNLGLAHLELGQAKQAVGYFELDLANARGLGDLRAEGRALGNLGLAHRLSGQPQRAIEYYDQHLRIARVVGDARGEGNSAWNRALALWALGRRPDAIAAAEAALRIRESIGDPRADKVRAALADWRQAAAAPGTGASPHKDKG